VPQISTLNLQQTADLGLIHTKTDVVAKTIIDLNVRCAFIRLQPCGGRGDGNKQNNKTAVGLQRHIKTQAFQHCTFLRCRFKIIKYSNKSNMSAIAPAILNDDNFDGSLRLCV